MLKENLAKLLLSMLLYDLSWVIIEHFPDRNLYVASDSVPRKVHKDKIDRGELVGKERVDPVAGLF